MLLDLNDLKQVEQFNQFIIDSPFGQVTQTTQWAELKSNWDHFHFYQTDDNQEIIAVMTVLTIKNKFGTFAYASRGPVADFTDVDLITTIVDEAVTNLPKDTFLLRLDPEVLDNQDLAQAYQQAGFTIRKTNEADLHYNIQPRRNIVLKYQGIQDEDQLMLHFKSDYRNQIRRAAKEGVHVDFGVTHQYVDQFFDLYVKMAKSQGITHRPIEYFYQMSDLWQDRPDLFRIYIAKVNDQPIAAGIGFGYGDEIWYMYAGSDREYAKLYGPYAVQWEMIKWGLQAGKKEYDFGGVSSFSKEDGLYVFKHGFAYSDPNVEYLGEIDKVLNSKEYLDFNQA